MAAVIKKIINRFMARPSGRRFLYAYLVINKIINSNILVRFLLFVLGFIFLLVGVVMIFTPGPGVLFIFLGGLFLCVISKKIAYFFDHLEVNSMRIKDKYWKPGSKNDIND